MELLNHCREQAKTSFTSLLSSARESVGQQLLEPVAVAGGGEEQRRFEAAQQLLRCGDAMLATFRCELDDAYLAFYNEQDRERSIDERIDPDSLSLVERETLEDEIVTSVIVSKATSQHAEALWKLNRRLAVLRGGKPVNDETNPFAPHVVGYALRVAVQELGLDAKPRILVYKQLGKVFVAEFGSVFSALNDTMAGQGILPNLRFCAGSEQGVGAAHEAGAAGQAADLADSLVRQRQLYDAIRSYLHAGQGAAGARTQTASGVSYGELHVDQRGAAASFGALDYALALSVIQQTGALNSPAMMVRPSAVETVEQRMVDQLLKHAAGDQRKVAASDAETVDMVGMIFRYMLDDPGLHDAVKSILSHLHTPYLKLALIDSTFLDNHGHPARILLNAMAEAGFRWVDSDDEKIMLPKIQGIVATVLNEFVDDISLFDQLNADFQRFNDNMQKRAALAEKRNTDAQKGLERLQMARQTASEAIAQRQQGQRLPAVVRMILEKPWVDLLSFHLLRHGENSDGWRAALRSADELVISVREVDSIADKSRAERKHRELQQTIAEGMELIGYDSDQSETMLAGLQHVHRSVLDGAIEPLIEAESVTDTAVVDSEALAADAVVLSSEEQRIVELLASTDFGTWFEFEQPGQEPQRLKLAWFSSMSSHYMFVNRAGVKQLVESAADLARRMCSGSVRIVEADQRSFMERALESIFNKLQGSSVRSA